MYLPWLGFYHLSNGRSNFVYSTHLHWTVVCYWCNLQHSVHRLFWCHLLYFVSISCLVRVFLTVNSSSHFWMTVCPWCMSLLSYLHLSTYFSCHVIHLCKALSLYTYWCLFFFLCRSHGWFSVSSLRLTLSSTRGKCQTFFKVCVFTSNWLGSMSLQGK